MKASAAVPLRLHRLELSVTASSFFYRHVNTLLERSEILALAFRASDLTRGHNTNNFSEVTIRIFKEVVLER